MLFDSFRIGIDRRSDIEAAFGKPHREQLLPEQQEVVIFYGSSGNRVGDFGRQSGIGGPVCRVKRSF